MTDHGSVSFGAEHEARQRQEDELRSLGRELREVFCMTGWTKLDEQQRKEAIVRALALARQRMGVAREITVLWTSDPIDRGYEESTGEMKIPRDDLVRLSAVDAVELVAHEMRHAWQWDVINGLIVPPGGEREQERLVEAYRTYDADDVFNYAHNELEGDARDRAACVVEGFL